MALGRSRRGRGISVREMCEELREIKGWIEVVWGGGVGECAFVAIFEDLVDGLCFKSSVEYSKFSRCVCLRGGMGGWLFSAVEFLKHVQGLVQIFAILCLFRVTSFHGSIACAFARVRRVFRRSSLENIMGKFPFFSTRHPLRNNLVHVLNLQKMLCKGTHSTRPISKSFAWKS